MMWGGTSGRIWNDCRAYLYDFDRGRIVAGIIIPLELSGATGPGSKRSCGARRALSVLKER